MRKVKLYSRSNSTCSLHVKVEYALNNVIEEPFSNLDLHMQLNNLREQPWPFVADKMVPYLHLSLIYSTGQLRVNHFFYKVIPRSARFRV